MKKRLAHTLTTLICLCLPPACGILDEGDAVEVRVRNASQLGLDEVTLFLPDTSLVVLDLGPGEATDYVGVTKAYRIASVLILAQGDSARLQVIDYVGESPLPPGRYTYALQVFPGPPLGLGLELEEDS
jgi:hypothetical protein